MTIASQEALLAWLLAHSLALAAAGKNYDEALTAARYLARKIEERHLGEKN